MLTKDLAIARYDFRRYQIVPDRLTTLEHAQYPDLAARVLRIYQNGAGLRRRELHRRVHAVFDDEPECPQRRIDAFCKLLDDASEYDDRGRREAWRLRQKVFRFAAGFHPLVERSDQLFDSTMTDVQQKVAEKVGRPWSEIESELFADVIAFHRLKAFSGFPTPRDFLSRYNVAQVQAALFSAISLEVRVTQDFKRILRSARLSGLMHSITRLSESSYSIKLDGPASVLRETRRYGTLMARFLPVLIACDGWSMQAIVETRSGCRMRLNLSSQDGLRSHLPDEEPFDSTVEARFAEKWGDEVRDGWTLHHEAEVLHVGQKTFIPDFVLRHCDGRIAYLEIVGFWTPEYISSRLQTHAIFRNVPILLAIHESTSQQFDGVESSDRMIIYKSGLQLKPVLEALAKID